MGRDTESFARVYDDEIWNVYGFFAYRLRRRDDAEDLTQQTFERALRAWDRYDPERASVGTWLVSIARNLLIDHYRRDRSGQEESIDEQPAERMPVAPGSEEPDLDIAPDLAEALEGLGQRERELIALRYGADMTGPEIAELTGLTLANVQQILSRSLRRMRSELESYADRGPTPARPTAATASRQRPDPA
jgi:RNA polymerase sigma-70 factor (ECF subfamily)